jgi:hypothetical protein
VPTSSGRPKPEYQNIQWQISARERIQKLILREWELLKKQQQRFERHDFYQIMRLIQVAYSLWRSAFLTNVPNNRQIILKRAEEFLERILTTNAIGFNDEFSNSHFTVAYYNNNAKYRLERECKYDKKLKNEIEFKNLLEIKKTTILNNEVK